MNNEEFTKIITETDMQDQSDNFENTEEFYRSLLSEPINENIILLEGGQGRHATGNMFALLREIEKNKKYSSLIPYFTVRRENIEEISLLFKNYGFHKVKLVRINSVRYKRVLATAKYLITDNSFPSYFIKRKEQIYINTWHGIPLKKIGRSRNEITSSIGNVQKNFLACDYILCPNEYTWNVLKNDYMLEGLYSGDVLFANYPRMDLFDNVTNRFIKNIDNFGLAGKKLIAYMPTWRDINTEEDSKSYILNLEKTLKKIDEQLSDNKVFLVHMHFLSEAQLDFSKYRHIIPFPLEYETYEVLYACDVLITDYSSVIFDYASLGRKTIVFAGDMDEYLSKNGLYMSPEDLGYDVVYSVEELIKIIDTNQFSDLYNYKISDYLNADMVNTSEKILDFIKTGKTGLPLKKTVAEEKEVIYYFAGDISKRANQRLFFNTIQNTDYDEVRPVLLFSNYIDDRISAFLKKLSPDISFMRLSPIVIDETEIEKGLELYKTSCFINDRMKSLYSFEYRRLLLYSKPGRYISLVSQGSRIEGLLAYSELKRLAKKKATVKADKNYKIRKFTDAFLSTQIEKNVIMYAAYRHKIMAGNPYAIFKYLIDNPEYSNFYHIWIYGNAKYLEYNAFIKYINHPRVRFISQDDIDDYVVALASSQYLVCNAALPDYWQKKEGQTYINTWHGTPLKTLGYDAKDYSESSISNAQRNFFQCDYLVLQSQFAIEKMVEAYCIKGIFCGKIIGTGMPRTDLVINTDRTSVIKLLEYFSGESLSDKKIVLYAPTFRSENGKSVDNSSVEIKYMMELVEKLPEGYEIFFKVHNMIQKYFKDDIKLYKRLIFDEIETNELLSVTDVLITDYSSVFFDFICKKKPILFFAYDYESYLMNHGIYLDYNDLPGALCRSVDEVIKCLDDIKNNNYVLKDEEKFVSSFAPYDDGDVCQRVVKGIFDNDFSLLDNCTMTSLDDKDNYLYELGDGSDFILISRLMSLLKERKYDRERVLVSGSNIAVMKSLLKYRDWDVRILCSSLEENTSSKEKEIIKNKGLVFSKEYYDRQQKKFYGDLKIAGLYKLNYKDSFLSKSYQTNYILPSNDYENKPLTVLVLATYDSYNSVLAPVVEEIIKQEGVPIVISYNTDDNLSNMPFTKKGIKCISAKKYNKKLLEIIDVVITTPINLSVFKEIMDDIKSEDVPVVSLATLYSSIVMRNYADFVFTIGESKVKEFDKYHMKYNFILSGNPQYDDLVSVNNNRSVGNDIKKVLIVDQGGYPYGAKGKKQLAVTLNKIASFHKDKDFYIKPRYVEGDNSHQVHNVSEYLIDYLDKSPDNMHFISESRTLEEMLPDYDAMITTWSTSFMAAMILDIPMILIEGLSSEDVFDVRLQRVDEAYEDLKKSGCVHDYKQLQCEKVEFKTADKRFLKEHIYNVSCTCSDKIVKALYLIKTELKDKELRILVDNDLKKPITIENFESYLKSVVKFDKNNIDYFVRKRYLSELNDRVQEYIYIYRCMGMPARIKFIDKYYDYRPDREEALDEVRVRFESYYPFASKRVNRWFDKTYSHIWENLDNDWKDYLKDIFTKINNRKYLNDEILYGYYFNWLYENGALEELLDYSGNYNSSGAKEYYCAKAKYDMGDIESAINYLIKFISQFIQRQGLVKTVLERRISDSLGYFLKGNTEAKILFYKKLQENDLLGLLDYYKGYRSEKNKKVLLTLFNCVCKNTKAEEIYSLLKSIKKEESDK